ncbi:MAG TPA: hypothetical protein DDW52_22770 [Planctomycetaceae bacterium]|nr:hypothetical protein [Planctomycetaceae bacterium]
MRVSELASELLGHLREVEIGTSTREQDPQGLLCAEFELRYRRVVDVDAAYSEAVDLAGELLSCGYSSIVSVASDVWRLQEHADSPEQLNAATKLARRRLEYVLDKGLSLISDDEYTKLLNLSEKLEEIELANSDLRSQDHFTARVGRKPDELRAAKQCIEYAAELLLSDCQTLRGYAEQIIELEQYLGTLDWQAVFQLACRMGYAVRSLLEKEQPTRGDEVHLSESTAQLRPVQAEQEDPDVLFARDYRTKHPNATRRDIARALFAALDGKSQAAKLEKFSHESDPRDKAIEQIKRRIERKKV